MDELFAACYGRGPQWVAGKSIFEQPLADHRAYVRSLHAAGTVLVAGPFLDDQGGLILMQAADAAAAERSIAADPAIRDGVMVAVLHPWRALAGAQRLA